MRTIEGCGHLGRVVFGLGEVVLRYLGTALRSRTPLASENLFLRKQVRLYRERRVRPRRAPSTAAWAAGSAGGEGATGHRWATFVRNHAQALVACDFCVVVTATFRVLYAFVTLGMGSCRLAHVNVTGHPTAA